MGEHSSKTDASRPRATRQRSAILAAIERADGPLTPVEIHARARRESDRLGIATVYRTIKLLIDTGEIQTVVLPDGETRYESAHNGHHHHFHCRRCNRVFDLEGCPVSIPPGATLPGGFTVTDHELTIFGLCPQCAEAMKTESS
jgi:Fur family ferric uptake transcriptional regulator